jgi:hypothetical protein
LLILAEVQQLTQEAHWGNSENRAPILREIWSKVLTIKDLAQISEGSVPASATTLYGTWGEGYDKLGERTKESTREKDRIVAAVEVVRSDAHDVLKGLD